MGSDAKRAFGAVGRDDLLYFDPEDLVIVTDPAHPLYDERAFLEPDERMIESVMHSGVIEPIVVRKNGETKGGKPIVEVVDGRQRVKATIIANHRLREVGAEPVRVPGIRKRGDEGDLVGLVITANEIRRGDPPLIRAKKLQRYLDRGRTLEDAGIVFGATQATLKGYLALLDCHPEVQKAIDKGRIGITHARALSAFPQAEQPGELEKLLTKTPGASEAGLSERLEQALGGRGKIRQRKVQTKKLLKTVKTKLEGSRAADAPLALAMIEWFLGKENALSQFRAIRACIDGAEEEE